MTLRGKNHEKQKTSMGRLHDWGNSARDLSRHRGICRPVRQQRRFVPSGI